MTGEVPQPQSHRICFLGRRVSAPAKNQPGQLPFEQEWALIPNELLDSLISGMRRRCKGRLADLYCGCCVCVLKFGCQWFCLFPQHKKLGNSGTVWNKLHRLSLWVGWVYHLQLASLCLSICTFTFNKQFYKQTRGTPMSSPLSSIISEIVMGSLDTWINQALPSDIYYWRRYVDDIFCIIKTDSLQLTYEIDFVLPFLDILIIRTPQSFHTSVFHKKHIPPQYTHFSSNSPIAFKINTVRTLTKRIFTHCSLPIFKTIERSRIHSLLTTAGYPMDFIEKHTFDPCVHRTTTIHRATCWLPFSPAAVSISRVLRPYGIKVLYNSPPNLATILRHHITKSDKPTLPINSTGAVYSVQCLNCPTSYVGETGRTTGIRISEHRRNIRNKDPKSLVFTHIAQTGHSFDLDHPQVKYRHIYNKHHRLCLESIISTQNNSCNRRIDLPDIYQILYK
ncbi:hypothetical protein LAZ67_4002587 [Cordylochernes scorpioides]|uniref:Helix-turn-helix domain-containing protein n=1 Tax=Cordylochernes scorpioides TaxID=51811 RepID=A0ABY6KEP3_9ARAC|nr:hypothetical protein LAZ67_4002587 [Cordylochernes scorpioides]